MAVADGPAMPVPEGLRWRAPRIPGELMRRVIGTAGAQQETHVAFLRENVAILENLELEHVKPGRYFLAAQPLKIGGAEAAPVRAVLLADYVFWSGSKA